MVSDLGQIEKRLERLEKIKEDEDSGARERVRVAQARESSRGNRKPLREMEMTPEDKKRLRGLCS